MRFHRGSSRGTRGQASTAWSRPVHGAGECYFELIYVKVDKLSSVVYWSSQGHIWFLRVVTFHPALPLVVDSRGDTRGFRQCISLCANEISG